MSKLRTLREHVESEGPLPVRDALAWVTRATKTLALIHQQDRVHGAMSADAIMISPAGYESKGAIGHPDDLPDAPAYHCRDRAEGGEPSRADDTWALCVTLFYALTGALPFPRGVLSWVKADKRQPPPIAVHGTDLAVMEVILGKLLDPNEASSAVPTAAALVLQLRAFSPVTGGLPPLPLEHPREGIPEAPIALPLPPLMPNIQVGFLEPGEDVEEHVPSPALLMSLPPAPPEPEEPAPAPGRRRLLWVALFVAVGLLMAAIAAAVALP